MIAFQVDLYVVVGKVGTEITTVLSINYTVLMMLNSQTPNKRLDQDAYFGRLISLNSNPAAINGLWAFLFVVIPVF